MRKFLKTHKWILVYYITIIVADQTFLSVAPGDGRVWLIFSCIVLSYASGYFHRIDEETNRKEVSKK